MRLLENKDQKMIYLKEVLSIRSITPHLIRRQKVLSNDLLKISIKVKQSMYLLKLVMILLSNMHTYHQKIKRLKKN